ncbi:MAG: hypothetical protein PF447_05885 [Spirochaetaceae bacterium]|jgi:hypothetical protein|nr:hypothetical protein [Spirochaetaceae bacterium]
MEAGQYSEFEYAELSHDPELKDNIFKEVRSQLVNLLYHFADRKLGIKDESDMKNKIYERQQVTTRYFVMLNHFDSQYQDLDDLYFSDSKQLLTYFNIKMGQMASELEKRENLDLYPDEEFTEELSSFCLSIKDRVKYIQYKNLAMKILKNLKLDLFIINLISQYMFREQDAAYDIRELAIYYKQDYGFQIAKLVSEIILRFIQLHQIQGDRSIGIADRIQLERGITEEIDQRIFVYRLDEKEMVYNRIKRIIKFGYTLTELTKGLRNLDSGEADAKRIQLLDLLGNHEFSNLIDGFLFEDMFNIGFDGNKGLNSKLSLLDKILKGYMVDHYDDRTLAVALLHLHNTDPDTQRISFYRIISALIEQRPEMVKTYTSYLLSLREILNRIWKEKDFAPPLPLVLHLWKTFDVMLRYYVRNFQEIVDVTKICEQSFNRVFIYNITRRPASVSPAAEKKKDFEKVISNKYDMGDIFIPLPNVLEICPDLMDSHFDVVDDIFVKLKKGYTARSDRRIKALILHSREDITLWLQRTRLKKLSSNLMMKENFSDELEALTEKIPLKDTSILDKHLK